MKQITKTYRNGVINMSNKYFEINSNPFAGVSDFVTQKRTKQQKFANFAGSDRPYLIRFAPPFDENGFPYVIVKQHNFLTLPTERGNQTISPVCLNFLLDIDNSPIKGLNEIILSKAVDSDKLDQETLEKWRLHGCPACYLANKLSLKFNKKDDKDMGAMGKLWQSFRAFANIIWWPWNEQTKKYDRTAEQGINLIQPMSQKLFTGVVDKFNIGQMSGINIFSPTNGLDAFLKVTGDNAAKRYSLEWDMATKPLAYDGEIYNLVDELMTGVRSFNEIATALRNTESIVTICKKYGVKL